MKREAHYIVYYKDTLKIVHTDLWMGKHILIMLRDTSLNCINVTHPKNKQTIQQINKANDTKYW